MFNTIGFAVYILLGWLVIGYLAFFTAGGLGGAWQFVRGLPLLVQILMWLIFLPWMIALWIFHMDWAIWLRLLLIAGVIWVTFYISIPPLLQLLRTPK